MLKENRRKPVKKGTYNNNLLYKRCDGIKSRIIPKSHRMSFHVCNAYIYFCASGHVCVAYIIPNLYDVHAHARRRWD